MGWRIWPEDEPRAGLQREVVDRKATLCHFPVVRFVRTLRNLLGIPQKNLAEDAGLSVRELQRVEAGDVVPSGDTVRGLDDAFDKAITRRLKEPHGSD